MARATDGYARGDGAPQLGHRVSRRRLLLSGGVLAAGSAVPEPGGRAAGAAGVAASTAVQAPPPSGGDDYAALAAAMPRFGVLELGAGIYHLSKNLAVPDGCDLR